MERWVFKYNRLWTIIVIKDGLMFYARATNMSTTLDTPTFITFNEAKDEAIKLTKQKVAV